jgi:hypothetical protein
MPVLLTRKRSKNSNSVPRARKSTTFSKTTNPFNNVLSFHKTMGNRAVQRLIESGALQTKLTVGKPNNIYEQEADQVAKQVMQMPDPEVSRKSEHEVSLQAMQEEEEQILQTKSGSGETPDVGSDIESSIYSRKGGGQPLPEKDRSFMERRFGIDFSGVRVHTGREAVQINRELNAQAFTHGGDIYFGAGRYSPGTSDGKTLLAHELTHVVQQRGATGDFRKHGLYMEPNNQLALKGLGIANEISVHGLINSMTIQRTIACPRFNIPDLAEYWSLNVITRISAARPAVSEYHRYENARQLLESAESHILVSSSCEAISNEQRRRMDRVHRILNMCLPHINHLINNPPASAGDRDQNESGIMQLLLIAEGYAEQVLGMLDPRIRRQQEAIQALEERRAIEAEAQGE